MDHGTVPTTDHTEERVDDHERACRDPYAGERDGPRASSETSRVRAWVGSLFSR